MIYVIFICRNRIFHVFCKFISFFSDVLFFVFCFLFLFCFVFLYLFHCYFLFIYILPTEHFLTCQHFSFHAKKSVDRERPLSLALRVVSLLPCLSLLAPSVTRVVICVSRTFCLTDQEKRETARSLVNFSLEEPITKTQYLYHSMKMEVYEKLKIA